MALLAYVESRGCILEKTCPRLVQIRSGDPGHRNLFENSPFLRFANDWHFLLTRAPHITKKQIQLMFQFPYGQSGLALGV